MFYSIGIDKFKYYVIDCLKKLLFLIWNMIFDDICYYWFIVWNVIGDGVSNMVYLNVIGSMFLYVM